MLKSKKIKSLEKELSQLKFNKNFAEAKAEVLEEETIHLKRNNEELKKDNESLLAFKDAVDAFVPIKIFHCKERKTTRVMFIDGSYQRVKLAKGDKNCLETALAYAIMKKMLHNKVIKTLLEEVEYQKIGKKINTKK